MTFSTFIATLQDKTPPQELSVLLQALWWDSKGDWDKAHDLVQDLSGKNAAWIHAYLHRKEGDPGNAAYWYSRASQPVCKEDLTIEWNQITGTLLQSH